MRVLAIDCALDACAAAVLESESGTIIASQTRVMVRGHAEALMPLIARVMDEAEVPAASPVCGLEFRPPAASPWRPPSRPSG
jgi:tRNA threonylcarbamoyladenosine biosynthesis protein TsaB